MKNKEKESIHQEFERFMRDEMDDEEKKKYIKSENYKTMINWTFYLVILSQRIFLISLLF